MGKGDKKSKRGKIHIGTFGVRRPRKKATKAAPAGNGAKASKKAGKKTAAKPAKKAKKES
jgi:30S ribosomal protein S31